MVRSTIFLLHDCQFCFGLKFNCLKGREKDRLHFLFYFVCPLVLNYAVQIKCRESASMSANASARAIESEIAIASASAMVKGKR